MMTKPDAGAGSRICRHCGCDCSDVPRVKDEKGRYSCRTCDDKLAAGRMDGEYGLVAGAAVEGRGSRVGGGGAASSHQSEADSHSMTGTECTTVDPKRSSLHSKLKEQSRAYWTRLILIPVVLTGFALAANLLLVTRITDQGTAVDFLIEYVLNLGVGILVFWICTTIWIGVDAPFFLSALRLAAVDGFAYLAYFAVAFALHPFVGLLAMFVVYLSLLATLMELEFGDAIMFAAIRILMKILVLFPLVSLLAALLRGSLGFAWC